MPPARRVCLTATPVSLTRRSTGVVTRGSEKWLTRSRGTPSGIRAVNGQSSCPSLASKIEGNPHATTHLSARNGRAAVTDLYAGYSFCEQKAGAVLRCRFFLGGVV